MTATKPLITEHQLSLTEDSGKTLIPDEGGVKRKRIKMLTWQTLTPGLSRRKCRYNKQRRERHKPKHGQRKQKHEPNRQRREPNKPKRGRSRQKCGQKRPRREVRRRYAILNLIIADSTQNWNNA